MNTTSFPRNPSDPRDPRASSIVVPNEEFGRGDFVLLGLPFDGAILSRPGARLGPKAFREALGSHTTFGAGVDLSSRICRARGALDLPPQSARGAHEGVQSAARTFSAERAVPFFIGGDNSLTGAILRGLAEARPNLNLGLVVIDAHYDVREYDD